MALTQDITFKPATELIGLMAAKELSPVELLEACLARIDALDGKINAFTHMLTDEARAAAVESEARIQRHENGPLEGLPVPIKDLALVSGTPITMGSRMAMEFPIMLDSEVVARLRTAGAVIPGKTHMPEFGSTISSESVKFGATRNPWDLDRSPGGSSSGAAAAVAAGLVPVAHGADGGGSLRIPAACCGLFTMKPTRARISQEPIGDVTENNVFGFLTHTVADNALLIDSVEGVAFGDPYWSSPLARPLVEEVGADPGKLRIGWTVKPPIAVDVDPEWSATVEDAARLCEELGHEVEPHDLDWNDEEGQALFLTIWSAEFSFAVEQFKRFGMDPDLLEPHNRALWEMGRKATAAEFLVAEATMHEYIKRLMESWKTYDVILTPGLAQPQPRIGWLFEDSATDPLSPLFPRSALVAPFCANFNFSGQPAAMLPLAVAADGMPIGVQAVGRFGDEATLFRLSAQIEAARPWADRSRLSANAGPGAPARR